MKQLIVGLDPSLTGTGVAVLRRDGDHIIARTAKFGRDGKRGETIAQRGARGRKLAGEVGAWIMGERTSFELAGYSVVPDYQLVLAVIEDAAYGAPGGSTWDRAGLWWRILDGLQWPGQCPVATMGRSTQLKWATGSGKTAGRGKSALSVPVSKLWPLDANLSDDEWDALGMATAGAQALGWPVTTYGYHRDGLRGAHWPEELAEQLTGVPV